jgi:hypothetical protein
VIDVEALEHRVGALLRLLAGHVLLHEAAVASALVLSERLRGDDSRAERDGGKELLHCWCPSISPRNAAVKWRPEVRLAR